jgi:hypothetical protein
MKRFLIYIIILLTTTQLNKLFAQKDSLNYVYDSFFLAKKKGIFGRLGKSITADEPKPELTITGVVKNNLPYNRYKGLPIRHINIICLDLNQDINDSSQKKRGVLNRLATAFHKKSKSAIIRNNLFFTEGDKLYPYLLADNERYLREQAYLEDAKITITPVDFGNAVDVYVYTKDVFSVGGSLNISGANNFDGELKDENFMGNATRISFKALYDEHEGLKWVLGVSFYKEILQVLF